MQRHRTDDEDEGQPLTTMSKGEEMIRRLRLLLPAGLLGPASLATLWLAAGPGHEQAGALYSVQEVQMGLAHDPDAWLGRTVWVRGIAARDSCRSLTPSLAGTTCRDWRLGLFDAAGAAPLPLTLGAPNPLLALLRRLPLAGQLVPPPQVVQWGAVATYRVQLRAAPAGPCASPACYEALLLDAAPDAPGEE
jgi:hypothetical protein